MNTEKRLKFTPLEERIVLDAAFFGDLADITYHEDSVHYFDHDFSLDDSHDFNDQTIDFHQDDDFVYTGEAIDISIDENINLTVFDLGEAYPAGDLLSQMGMLDFVIQENSSPDLVESSIEGDALYLNKVSQEEGVAEITVSGVFLDGSIYEAPFRVHINPSDQGLFLFETSGDDSKNPWIPMDYVDIDQDTETDLVSQNDSYRKLDDINISMLPNEKGDQSVREYVGFFGLASLEHAEWVSDD